MEKILDNSVDELIDLGSVTGETQGAIVGFDDTLNGQQPSGGLSDD
ncbi:benenodin family lasso peptide [Sphingobium sp.]|nr:benenodin family lasso peptide [Sphingobium sp.]HUD94063.1 benenodin family lasso peptide [Sphingobium sp.]